MCLGLSYRLKITAAVTDRKTGTSEQGVLLASFPLWPVPGVLVQHLWMVQQGASLCHLVIPPRLRCQLCQLVLPAWGPSKLPPTG